MLRAFHLSVWLFLGAAGTLLAEGRLEVANHTEGKIDVFVRRSTANSGRDWTTIRNVRPGTSVAIRLVSQDLFDIRIHFRTDDAIEELGADGIDLHRLSDQRGEFLLTLKHWATYKDGGRIDRYPYESAMKIRGKGGGGVVKLEIDGLVGHKPRNPVILP